VLLTIFFPKIKGWTICYPPPLKFFLKKTERRGLLQAHAPRPFCKGLAKRLWSSWPSKPKSLGFFFLFPFYLL
jgi:hypothetical protein